MNDEDKTEEAQKLKKVDVHSQVPEFGYELLSAVPYAKWLSDKGLLGKTVSGIDTKPLYWWSGNHIELNEPRGWQNQIMAVKEKLPNINIHTPNYDFERWSNPDWVNYYKNGVFVYEKPILCICNRVNSEWGKGVINYFDIPTLDRLFELLKPYYQIVYFNIAGRPELYDGVVPTKIGDYDFIRENHPDVKIVHDLHHEHKEYTFNELQLRIFANCEAFITMNGGYGIMASYFKGTNIIYSKRCRELDPKVNSFRRWYPKLGGQRIVVVNDYEALLDRSKIHFVDKILTFNVAMRTSKRPDAFDRAINSVMSQTYQNINVMVTVDEDDGRKYTVGYPCIVEKVDRLVRKSFQEFPFNLYFNALARYFQPGYVIHLDDDCLLANENVLKEIADTMETRKSDMVCWRVAIGDVIIPSDRNYGKYPVKRDFSGGCFAVRTEKWQPWKGRKQGDWELATRLFDTCVVWWLPDILFKAEAALHVPKNEEVLKKLFITEINYNPRTMNPIVSKKQVERR